jgi:hypothetical protein
MKYFIPVMPMYISKLIYKEDKLIQQLLWVTSCDLNKLIAVKRLRCIYKWLSKLGKGM